MTMMKAALVAGGAGIDAIAIRALPVPVPAAGEALVRLRVATLNFRDLLGVHGKLHAVKTPEYIPLSCGRGRGCCGRRRGNAREAGRPG